MPTPALFPIDWHQFDHIVLDFGGVLYEIDHNRTAKAFAELGLPNFEQEFRHSQQSDLFNAIETGGIDENDFLNSLRDRCDKGTTNEDVLEAWNALLIGLRPEAMPWLKTLNHQFDVILFSNTNALHAAHFEQQILNSKTAEVPRILSTNGLQATAWDTANRRSRHSKKSPHSLTSIRPKLC